MNASTVVRALNVGKGHKFSHLDKSMKFGTDDLHAILFQNFDGSNLRVSHKMYLFGLIYTFSGLLISNMVHSDLFDIHIRHF